MDTSSLIEQLLGLPDKVAQARYLEQHLVELDDRVAAALKAQADQFLRVNLQRSLQISDLLCRLADITHNPAHRALGLLAEANARSIGQREYQRAIDLYDEAAGLYRAQNSLVDEAKSQVGKIGALFYLARYEEALQVGRWASTILETQGERRAHATLIMNMGVMYDRLGDLPKALEMVEQAGEIDRQLGVEGEAGLGLVEMNRAAILRNLGRFDAAIAASQAAQAILIHLGQNVEAARAQQSRALTYFVLGRYNEALELLDQVRDIFIGDGRQRDALLADLFSSDCLLKLRRFREVLEKCDQVRGQFAEIGARHVMAQAIVNEAVAYTELGRYAEALTSLAEARDIFARTGNPVQVAATDLEIAAVQLHQQRYHDCLTAALRCAAVFRDHQLPVEEAQAQLVAARAAIALNLAEQARQLNVEALSVGETRNLPTLLYQGHYLLGTLLAAQGEAEAALREYDRAIQELERLRGRLMIEFRAGFLEDKGAVYEEAAGLCIDHDQPQRGFEYAERAKSRALLDLLAQRIVVNVQARDETDRPLVDQLLQLRAERDRLYRRWESDEASVEQGWLSSDSDRQQAQQAALMLEKRITETWHRLLIRNADYARDVGLWAVRTEPIQPYLPPDTLLLEYFVVHHQLIVFLMTPTTVESVRLSGELSQIQSLMQLLGLNLRAVPRSAPQQVPGLADNARSLLKRLYNLLIAPLADKVSPYPHLIIVPHGPLHYLPFHALTNGDAYLLEQHEISYMPSASVLRYCQGARPGVNGLIAVGHSYAGRLPHAVREARSIARLMQGRAFVEEAATLSQTRQLAGECRMLHFATHGDFRPDNPLFSGLALADGWLTTLDIFNMNLRASLVTLSACRTGSSVIGGGDELLGLMRAFLSAGAASLVLSFWEVEDRSTAQLMETFYARMLAGETKAAALRHAQLQFLTTGSSDPAEAALAHPYFWAPFFLVGDGGPL